MSYNEIIRAWKDEDFRGELTEEQQSQLPENPAGVIDLSVEDMEHVAGGGLVTWSAFENPLGQCKSRTD
jgi:mersacidin/lichenicidin family type 2 lantibiotic